MNYKPKKQLGQNFLTDKNVLMRIVDVANITKEDIILEIGPGQGSMTYHLAEKAKKVIAVEKDEKLVKYLENKFKGLNNLEIINDDILNFLVLSSKYKVLRGGEYKVVGNIPYYLTSRLIRELLALENKPSEIILMVQKEVAERIVAKAGQMNLLAISIQLFAEPAILFNVSKNSFWPKPKVDSAVIKLRIKKIKNQETNKLKDTERFFKIVKVGFSAKRKMLANNLAKGLGIEKEKIYDIFKSINININSRAQDLLIEDWINFLKHYEKEKEK